MNDTTQSDPDRHPLDLLAEEFADRWRRGEHPTVSDYVRKHPALADGLRQVLPPIALMEKLKRRNTSGNGAALAPLKLEKLGDFRIVREIGRGGMGIVYEAWQESLGRHVALKVLSRASLLDPQRLQRFEREARAAAGLHHTNIVPVFGVGEQEGLHYYVMQFIDGRALSELLAEAAGKPHPGDPTTRRVNGSAAPPGAASESAAAAPVPLSAIRPPAGKRYWAWVANIGRQVADALQYAHRQGVLHRDIKPANLLLDGKGIVWVADFGLAKLADPTDVTRSGDVIGTLQYMAPEGLKSQSDARSDVYALGLTMYELLTLRPAFSEPSPAALMRRLSESGPVQPRWVNPNIPRDLETIILKATARDPAQRYASAGELAEDLENFLHDRPLLARRASAGERAWRWCRRNRAVSSLAAAAAMCALAAIVVGWVAYGVTRRALAAEASRRGQAESATRLAETAKLQAEAARHHAEAAEKRAEANVALSLKSFEEIFNRIAPEETMPPPSSWGEGPGAPPPPPPRQRDSSQDAAVLQSVLNFYERFAQQNSTSRSLEFEAAKAYRRVGDSYLRLGRSKDADTANRRAVEAYGRLLEAQPTVPDYQAGFADAATWVGFPDAKASPADVQLLHRASALAEQLVKSSPRDADYNMLLARTLFREAVLLRDQGLTAAAEQALNRAVRAWEVRPDPRHPGRRFSPPQSGEPAAVLQTLAELQWDAKREDEARKTLRHAFDELERPATGPRRGPAERAALAALYARIARAATKAGESELAGAATARADEVRHESESDDRRDARRAQQSPRDDMPDEPPPRGPRGGDRPPPPEPD